jgi:hypothetical protein
MPIMLWTVISWLVLIGALIMLVLAIAVYRIRRCYSFTLLMWALVCFVVARTSPITFTFVEAFYPHHDIVARTRLQQWQQFTELTFQLLFIGLMIVALVLFLRERKPAATPSV